MRRKALGKGLRSLIPEAPSRPPVSHPVPFVAHAGAQAPPGEAYLQIDIDLIRPNPDQPRQIFDPVSLDELARSLKQQGVLQPVIVRPVGDNHYELVAGERRWAHRGKATGHSRLLPLRSHPKWKMPNGYAIQSMPLF